MGRRSDCGERTTRETRQRGNHREKRWMPKQTLFVASFFSCSFLGHFSLTTFPLVFNLTPLLIHAPFSAIIILMPHITYSLSSSLKIRDQGREAKTFASLLPKQTERERERQRESKEGRKDRGSAKEKDHSHHHHHPHHFLSFAVTALLTLDFCGQSLLLLSSLWKHYSVYGFFRLEIGQVFSQVKRVCLSVCDNMNPNTESPCEADRK